MQRSFTVLGLSAALCAGAGAPLHAQVPAVRTDSAALRPDSARAGSARVPIPDFGPELRATPTDTLAPPSRPAAAPGLPQAAVDAGPRRAAAFVRPFAPLGGPGEEYLRLAQLGGGAPAAGFLLRSASSLNPRRAGGAYLALLAPHAQLVWNSRIPFSLNDGPMWAGRGASFRAMAGVEAAAGPLRVVLAPEWVHQENRAFDALLPPEWDEAQRGTFTPPWSTGIHSADLPYRFGGGSESRLLAGESSATLAAGPVEAGVATESQWWGPGVRNALLLSNHAGGFPHALLRTARPVRTPLGALDARWIAGRLSSSPFDTASAGRHRSLSAAALVLSPGPNVSVGVARVVYGPAGGGGAARRAAEVFTRWGGAGDTTRARPFDQMLTLFGRLVIPGEGAEVYAEWGRRRLPGSLREALERPEHTQGYTLGAAWARPAGAGRLRLQGEHSYVEKSPTYRAAPTGSWYAGRAVPQGYTHRGQVLGAALGPGGSGQWAAADYLADRWQAGAFAGRIRWANDAYYDQGPNRYRGHDVTVLGGARAGIDLAGARLSAEWTVGKRWNFLFQNDDPVWERGSSVNVVNHTLRVGLSAAPQW